VILAGDDRIRDILAGAGMELAVLFGSAATEPSRLRADSDVDIAVLFPRGHQTTLAELGDLAASLSRALGREVDLVDLAGASTVLRFEAARGRRLYEARPGAFGEFAARAALEYDDLRPILLRCGWGMLRKMAGPR
jgi:predicted nucleotidyltransferase